MKKNKTKKKQPKKYLPYGRVILELVIWDFSQDENIICHTANELAKAIQLSYNLSNFGTHSFGLEEED